MLVRLYFCTSELPDFSNFDTPLFAEHPVTQKQ